MHGPMPPGTLGVPLPMLASGGRTRRAGAPPPPRPLALCPTRRLACPNTLRIFFSRQGHFFHLSSWVWAVQSGREESSSGRGMSMADAQTLCRPLALGQRPGPAAANQTDRELVDRFLRQQDEAAFAALVQRHGPMVLALCRRILDHEQDAEDAFQATFLILVRRAGTLDNPDLLSSWLYGVAYRTARKARTQAARRRAQERQVASVTTAEEPPVDHAWRELRSVLDDELNRLP